MRGPGSVVVRGWPRASVAGCKVGDNGRGRAIWDGGRQSFCPTGRAKPVAAAGDQRCRSPFSGGFLVCWPVVLEIAILEAPPPPEIAILEARVGGSDCSASPICFTVRFRVDSCLDRVVRWRAVIRQFSCFTHHRPPHWPVVPWHIGPVHRSVHPFRGTSPSPSSFPAPFEFIGYLHGRSDPFAHGLFSHTLPLPGIATSRRAGRWFSVVAPVRLRLLRRT